jgi:hypothetical protein
MKPARALPAVLAGLSAVVAASTSLAGSCRPELAASTPATRFEAKGDVVTDTGTGLTWMRCALGQHWTAGSCAGEAAVMTWSEALSAIDDVNLDSIAGHDDWRLPKLPELASIVERQCFNPRVNEQVFPGAPSQVFWSSMEKPGVHTDVYALDFGGGAVSVRPKAGRGAVRLVRGGPWWTPPAASAK